MLDINAEVPPAEKSNIIQKLLRFQVIANHIVVLTILFRNILIFYISSKPDSCIFRLFCIFRNSPV